MTKEEWKEVERNLSSPYGRAKFKIDGYTVDVVVEKESPKSLKYVLAVFVDGAIKGKWLVNDCDIRRKFYYKCTKSNLSANYKNSYKFKSLSKKVREEIYHKGYTEGLKMHSYKIIIPLEENTNSRNGG